MELQVTNLTSGNSMFQGPTCELDLLKEFPAKQFPTVKALAIRPEISRKIKLLLSVALGSLFFFRLFRMPIVPRGFLAVALVIGGAALFQGWVLSLPS